MKNREEMSWKEEKAYILTLLKGKRRLTIAENCEWFLSGLCCESLDSGRTWTCLFIRDYDKGTVIQCEKYKEQLPHKKGKRG